MQLVCMQLKCAKQEFYLIIRRKSKGRAILPIHYQEFLPLEDEDHSKHHDCS